MMAKRRLLAALLALSITTGYVHANQENQCAETSCADQPCVEQKCREQSCQVQPGQIYEPPKCDTSSCEESACAIDLPCTKKCKRPNPFEMVIFNIGRGNFSQPKVYSGSYIQAPSEEAKNKLIEMGIEVPFYKDYTALGFQFDIINGHQMVGTEYTLSVKFRLPFHFRFGDIALTNTYRGGVVALFYTVNNDYDYDTFQFGVIGVPVIGVDYFPIRWLGFYCEYSWRFANVFLNRKDIENSAGKKIGTENHPYSYSTTGLSFGLKLTF